MKTTLTLLLALLTLPAAVRAAEDPVIAAVRAADDERAGVIQQQLTALLFGDPSERPTLPAAATSDSSEESLPTDDDAVTSPASRNAFRI